MFLLFVCVVLLLIGYKLAGIALYWRNRGVPYESFASYLHFAFIGSRKEDIYILLRKLQKKYGPVYGTYLGITPALRVTDLDIAREVLVKKFHIFFRRSFEGTTANPLWDQTLFGLDYVQWKKVRQMSSPAFTSLKFKACLPKLNKVSLRLADQLSGIASSKDNCLELKVHLEAYALDSIGAAAYGIELEAMKNPDGPFVKNSRGIFSPSPALSVLTFMPKLFRFIPFLHFPSPETTNFFLSFTSHLIKERRQRTIAPDASGDFLDIWLNAQKQDPVAMTDGVIISQAFTFLVAGFEAVAFGVHHLLYFLAVNPDAQEKAVAEIETVIGDRNELDFEDIQNLPYIRACIDETLRLVPTDWVVDRIASERTTVGGIEVEPGTVIQMPIAALNFDPKNFPDPEKFKPERFMKNSSDGSNVAAYLNFGDGPKSCIGRRMANFTISQAVVHILKSIRVEACDQTPPHLEFLPGQYFMPMSTKPMVIKLTKRN